MTGLKGGLGTNLRIMSFNAYGYSESIRLEVYVVDAPKETSNSGKFSVFSVFYCHLPIES